MKFQAIKFTLLELVVVMTIIAVLLSTILIGVRNMAPSENLKVGVHQLEGVFELARNTAIFRQEKVAVLLPYQLSSADEVSYLKQSGGELARSYRLCVVTGDPGEYKFKSYIQGQEWGSLSRGLVIAGILDSSDSSAIENIGNPYEATSGNANKEGYIDTKYKVGHSVFNGNAIHQIVSETGTPEVISFYNDSTSASNWRKRFLVKDVRVADNGNVKKIACTAVVFNRNGIAENTAGLYLLLTEGRLVTSNNAYIPTFNFTKIAKNNNGDFLANWAEIKFDLFSGRPIARFQGTGWGE